MMQTVR